MHQQRRPLTLEIDAISTLSISPDTSTALPARCVHHLTTHKKQQPILAEQGEFYNPALEILASCMALFGDASEIPFFEKEYEYHPFAKTHQTPESVGRHSR